MRAQEPRRDRIETLEPRHLLSATDCLPCREEMPPDVVSSQAEFAPVETNEATQLNIASSSAVPRTVFGEAQVIELDEGTQRVAGDLVARPVYPFYFELAEDTDLTIQNSAGSSAEFGIYTLQSEVVAQDIDGVIDLSLKQGEYLLYAYDFVGNSSSFELAITIPETPQFIEEFPEVPYIGRDFDWNLNAVNAPEVWAQGFTGEGTIVAVLDTGVDYTHPDLDDNIFLNPGEIAGDGIDNDGNGYVDDVRGFDFAYFDNDPSDVNGHGTHVAGSIAAERNGFGTTGVAYDATILPVKVLRDNGSGSPNAIAAGIRYAVDVGADIINLSLGGGATRSVVNALRYAWANDVLVVAASGNDAAPRPGAPAIYSSVFSNTISVGAHSSGGNRSSFSNQVGNSSAVQIDAPGSRIASTATGGGYRFLSGTSMATPHVAGVASLAYSANPDLRASDVRSFLTDGANRTINGSDSIGGVNAARTVALAYQFDTFGNFDSVRGASSSVVTGSARTEFAFSTASHDVASELAAITAVKIDVDDSANRFRTEESHDQTEPELIHRRRVAAADIVFAQAEPQSFDLPNPDSLARASSTLASSLTDKDLNGTTEQEEHQI